MSLISLNLSPLINRIRRRDPETSDSLLRLQQAVDQLQQVVTPLIVAGTGGISSASGAHRLLSATHDDTTVATVARGDVITGQGVPPKWKRLPVGTVSQTLQSTGTDVAWGAAPAAAPHAILSATHSDTTPAAVARGGLMVGQTATPKWQQLTVGTAGQVLTSNGTDAAWATPAAAGAHNFLSATHTDTAAAAAVRGDVIVANSTPAWSRLAIGTNGQVLTSNGTDAAWAAAGVGVAVGTGTDATKSGTSAGDLWLPSDGFYIRRYTGAAWANWGPIFPMTEPVDGDYAWVNQGGASTTTTNGGIFLSGPATAGNSLRIRKKAAPGTPYTITVAFYPLLFPANDPYCGILFRESGTGKLVTMYIEYNTWFAADWAFSIAKWTNETTFDTYYDSGLDAAPLGGNVILFRMTDNATNLIFSFSRDGQNFRTVRTVSRTDFMAGAPDEVGFFVNAGNASNDAGMTLLNWKQT